MKSIFAKYQWLENEAEKEWERFVSRRFDEVASRTLTSYPRSVVAVMKVEILYTVLRYFRWSDVRLFRDLICEVLVASYGCSRKCGENIVESIHADFKFIYRPDPAVVMPDEGDFLKYMSLQVLKSQDDFGIQDLMFGQNVLLALKKDIEQSDNASRDLEAGKVFRFTPQIQARINVLLIEATRELKRNPLKVDKEYLKFHLWQTEGVKNEWIADESVERAFDFMLGLASAKPKKRQLGTDFLGFLHRSGLTFQESDRAKWCLSELGKSLTANGLVNEMSVEITTIDKLNEYAQIAALSRFELNAMVGHLDYLAERLAPRALLSFAKRLVNQECPDDAERFVPELLRKVKNPLSRRLFCTWCIERLPNSVVVQHVKPHLGGETSPAISGLIKSFLLENGDGAEVPFLL